MPYLREGAPRLSGIVVVLLTALWAIVQSAYAQHGDLPPPPKLGFAEVPDPFGRSVALSATDSAAIFAAVVAPDGLALLAPQLQAGPWYLHLPPARARPVDRGWPAGLPAAAPQPLVGVCQPGRMACPAHRHRALTLGVVQAYRSDSASVPVTLAWHASARTRSIQLFDPRWEEWRGVEVGIYPRPPVVGCAGVVSLVRPQRLTLVRTANGWRAVHFEPAVRPE